MPIKQHEERGAAKSKTVIQPMIMRPEDLSGTPIALIESARRLGTLEIREEVLPVEILVEFPMGVVPQEQTGCSRFVRLRSGNYSLIQ